MIELPGIIAEFISVSTIELSTFTPMQSGTPPAGSVRASCRVARAFDVRTLNVVLYSD